MSKLIIASLLILNIFVLYQNGDSLLPYYIGIGIPGFYKGISAHEFNEVFNLHKVKYSLKSTQQKLELLCAILVNLSIQIGTYKELYILRISPSILEIAYLVGSSILYTFIFYRFLFLNMFKNEEKA